MGWRRILVVAVAASLALLVSAPALAAGGQAPVALHLMFRLIARGVSDLQVSGPFVSFTQTASTSQRTVERFVLLDDRTGKRIVTLRGCDAGVLREPRVGLYCSSSMLRERYTVYNIRTRKLHQLLCIGQCQRDFYFQNLAGVGSKWFEVEVEPHQSCGDGVHYSCGPTTFAFYNIHNGKQRVPHVTQSQIVDLNSASLTRRLCTPLREPAGYSPTTATGWTVRFDGSFAIAEQASGIYVEPCGSHLHLPLVTAPYEGTVLENAQGVAFCSAVTEGFLLPSLKPFTLRVLPSTVAALCPLLGARHAYAVDGQSQLWVASLPPSLRESELHKRRPHHVRM